MAIRSRDTFKKRQKELLRVEKQRDKAARRFARKSAKELGGAAPSEDIPETGPDSDSLSGQQVG